MTLFCLCNFQNKKVSACECHWYECFKSLINIKEDLMKKPVVLIEKLDFHNSKKESSWLRDVKLPQPGCVIISKPADKCFSALNLEGKEQKSGDFNLKTPCDEPPALSNDECVENDFEFTNKKCRINLVFESEDFNEKAGNVSLHKSAPKRIEEFPNSFSDEIAQFSTITKSESSAPVDERLTGFKGQRQDVNQEDHTRDRKVDDSDQEHMNDDNDFPKVRFVEETSLYPQLVIPTFSNDIMTSNASWQSEESFRRSEALVSHGSKESGYKQLTSDNSRLEVLQASCRRGSMDFEEEACKEEFTISPCRVALSPCFDNVIGRPRRSCQSNQRNLTDIFVKNDQHKDFGLVKPTESIENRFERKRNHDRCNFEMTKNHMADNPFQGCHSQNGQNGDFNLVQLEDEEKRTGFCIRKKSSESSRLKNTAVFVKKPIRRFTKIARDTLGQTEHGRKPFDENAFKNYGNRLTMLGNSRNFSDSEKTNFAYFNRGKRKHCFKVSKNESRKAGRNIIDMNSKVCLSPCKVHLERLDVNFKNLNNLLRRERVFFNHREKQTTNIAVADDNNFLLSNTKEKLEFCDEYFPAEVDPDCISHYDMLEYKGRLRANPKQRDPFESVWLSSPRKKRNSNLLTGLHRKKGLSRKRKRKSKPKTDLYAKSLDFINKRFINQNALSRLLSLESV